MSWPPVWEETFVDPAKKAAYEQHIVAEFLSLPAASQFSPKQIDTICWVLSTMDEWASSLIRDLRDCPWTHDQLRGSMPPLKTEKERKKWERYRWRLDGHDACWATRESILDGDWIEAISWAMQAGNRLNRDHAAIGRASAAALSNPDKSTTHADQLATRDALIQSAAERMRQGNPALSENGIAARLAGKTIGGMTLPGAEAIRKILRDVRKLGTPDAPSQP